MSGKLLRQVAFLAGALSLLAAPAEAALSDGALAGRAAVSAPAPVELAQYFFGGRQFCWYPVGWRGPGWYWCGYAWRTGLGWGGGFGWRGWGGGGGGWRGGHGWRHGPGHFGGHGFGHGGGHRFGGGRGHGGGGHRHR